MVAPALILAATTAAAVIWLFFAMSLVSVPLDTSTQISALSASQACLQIESSQQQTAMSRCYDELENKRSDIDSAMTQLCENVDPDMVRYYQRGVYHAEEIYEKVKKECEGLEN